MVDAPHEILHGTPLYPPDTLSQGEIVPRTVYTRDKVSKLGINCPRILNFEIVYLSQLEESLMFLVTFNSITVERKFCE